MISKDNEDVPLIMAVENGSDSEAMNRGGLFQNHGSPYSQSHLNPTLKL